MSATKVVAGAVGAVELGHGWPWRSCRSATRTRFGLVSEKAGCCISRRTRVERARLGDRGLQREPFVEHERLVGEASSKRARARLAGVARGSAQRRRARRDGRSCCRPSSNCASARPRAVAGSRRRRAGRARRCAGRAGRRSRHRGCRRRSIASASRSRAQRRARSPGRRSAAKSHAGAVDRVGIDVAADLAGDVGLARQRQHLRGEGGVGPCARSKAASASPGGGRKPARRRAGSLSAAPRGQRAHRDASGPPASG